MIGAIKIKDELPDNGDISSGHPVWKEQFDNWIAYDLDNKHRYSYDFQENSNLILIGGHEADQEIAYAQVLFDRCGHNCNVHLFSPYMQDYGGTVDSLNSTMIHFYNYSLGSKDNNIVIPGFEFKEIQVRELGRVLQELALTKVELLYTNCEGCEWDLLPHIMNSNLAATFEHLQVQVHCTQNLGYTKSKYVEVRELLTTAYETSYHAMCLWDGWHLKH
jgi:hypothetical protein